MFTVDKEGNEPVLIFMPALRENRFDYRLLTELGPTILYKLAILYGTQWHVLQFKLVQYLSAVWTSKYRS